MGGDNELRSEQPAGAEEDARVWFRSWPRKAWDSGYRSEQVAEDQEHDVVGVKQYSAGAIEATLWQTAHLVAIHLSLAEHTGGRAGRRRLGRGRSRARRPLHRPRRTYIGTELCRNYPC